MSQKKHRYQSQYQKHVQAALLNQAELQTLYQRAHAAALSPPQCLLEQQQLGDIASHYRGTGLDYEESRLYQAGDEPRFINWRLTARSGKTQLKQFREERRPAVFILLDQSNTMRFGTRSRLKVTQATRLAALIAFAAAQQGWAVSALRLKEDNTQAIQASAKQDREWFPLGHDSHTIWQWVQQWAEACPPLQTDNLHTQIESVVNTKTTNFNDLKHLLPVLSHQLQRGTHIYLLSDFIDLDHGCNPAILQLQQQHPIFSIHIIDPIELELPNIGQINLYDTRTGVQQKIDLSSTSLRQQFKHNAMARQAAIQQQLQGAGCHYYSLLTPEEMPEKSIPLPHGMGL
jgi:uncharacterized protein (DUF58 family)